MASCKQLFALFIFSTRVLSIWFPTKCVADCVPNDKVNLSVYYETLCPYCANFLANSLAPVLQTTDLASIMNVRLVPWGNALIDADYNVNCQHGPDECMLNAIHACVIKTWPDLETHFRFIQCTETLVLEDNHSDWTSCFSKTGLPREPISKCYGSGQAAKLEVAYANETANLQPEHAYVPWVTVNNQPIGPNYENFVSYVCNAYKGCNMPAACNSVMGTSYGSAMSVNSLDDEPNVNSQVSYATRPTDRTSLANAVAHPRSIKLPSTHLH